MKKFLRVLMVAAMALTIAMPMVTLAQVDADSAYGINDVANSGLNLSNDKDPKEIAASIINIILGFLGLLAVVIILIGGFKWMTAGGNEENVASAQKIIVAGVIGLVIILASWGIATFVLQQISGAVQN